MGSPGLVWIHWRTLSFKNIEIKWCFQFTSMTSDETKDQTLKISDYSNEQCSFFFFWLSYILLEDQDGGEGILGVDYSNKNKP